MYTHTRAYRTPADTWLTCVSSSATTRMQSAGHAAAQSEQPTHFSSPLRWRCSRWRPRNRGYTGRLYSGYCCVIGFLKSCLNVTAKPLTLSIGCGLISVHPDHEKRGDDGVDRRDGQQHLPPESHQLVVPEAGHRRAHPDEERHQQEELDEEPQRPERRVGAVPAGEEERHGKRGERDQV